MELSLISIGEVMTEICKDRKAEFDVGFAGDTYNTAVYCARSLKAPGRVGYMTRLGSDPLSKAFVDVAKNEGINTDSVGFDASRNIGIYTVETDRSGERRFSYWRDNSAARGMFSSSGEGISIPKAQITYLSGITLAILSPSARKKLLQTLRILKQARDTMVAFDSNYRPKLWESAEAARTFISEMWEIADIALPSMDDEMALFDEARESLVVDRFAAMKNTACAIKRSDRGPICPMLDPSAYPGFLSARNVIDTTAAGDSFNGAYLAAFLCGKSQVDCMKAGHALASSVVGVPGAIASQT